MCDKSNMYVVVYIASVLLLYYLDYDSAEMFAETS